MRDPPGASRQSCESAAAPLQEVSPGGSRLSCASEELSSLFGMTYEATMPSRGPCHCHATVLAMGGRPPPSLLCETGGGRFRQHLGCFAECAL